MSDEALIAAILDQEMESTTERACRDSERDSESYIGAYLGSPVTGQVEETYSVWLNAREELARMAPIVGDARSGDILHYVRMSIRDLLRSIESGVLACTTRPWLPVRLMPEAPPLPLAWDPLRVGVIPITVDIIDWRCILDGLAAMVQLRLDRVVYVLTESVTPSEIGREARSEIAGSVLKGFAPLLSFVPPARGARLRLQDELARFARLNLAQPMELHLVVEDEKRPADPGNLPEDTHLHLDVIDEPLPGLPRGGKYSIASLPFTAWERARFLRLLTAPS